MHKICVCVGSKSKCQKVYIKGRHVEVNENIRILWTSSTGFW